MIIKGQVKGLLTTYDCIYQKVLKDKEQIGLISINNLLKSEFKDSKINSIYFCDKEHTICLRNHHNDTYVEYVHECFDRAYQLIYLICDNETDYNNLKFYIKQSSKYHDYLEEVNETPYKESFEKIFLNDSTIVEESTKNKEDVMKNYFEVDGKIINISKEFVKNDNSKARFINVEQKYEFGGKIKKNILSVMLEKDKLYNYSENIKAGDVVNIIGTISSYKDKNDTNQIIVNCNKLKVLTKFTENIIER